jgi:hypothetical protein
MKAMNAKWHLGTHHNKPAVFDDFGAVVLRPGFVDEFTMEDAEAVMQLASAAPTMYDALEVVLSWLTNVNTHEPFHVAAKVIEALRLAGADESNLDGAALAMLSGAAHR